MYESRSYHDWVKAKDLVKFRVIVKETDLLILAEKDLTKEAFSALKKYRQQIEDYIRKEKTFLTTLKPLSVGKNAAEIVRQMAWAGKKANVGPMAAVAGALAEYVGRELLKYSSQVIVENGGDIFLRSKVKRKMGIFAGENSPYTKKLALEINQTNQDLGLASSSGTVGHSLSFGRADCALVICQSAALADSYATALGNRIKKVDDIGKAISFFKRKKEILGLLAIMGKKIGLYGEVKLVTI
jgi:ApbE superfamily uncharacterized protein (UPF0280 family)